MIEYCTTLSVGITPSNQRINLITICIYNLMIYDQFCDRSIAINTNGHDSEICTTKPSQVRIRYKT